MIKSSNIVKDGFIFSGNWQQTVARILFLDQRLTPLERNAWQVIRMMLEPDGITALPTYEQLRPYLTSMPYAKQASFETVARALTILRLTRWLSLSKRRRAREGFKQSNLYILHDEPLTPFEAIRLDEDYLVLVCQSISHASAAVRKVAEGVLEDIANDPFLSGKRFPTRLEVLLGRMSEFQDDLKTQGELSTALKSEESESDLLRNQKELTSESEASLKTAKNHILRNPNKVVSSSNNINILLHNAEQYLNIPKRFYALRPAQQKGILTTIQKLSRDVQQQIFNEWEDRCQNQVIRKPASYLFGIVQKAFKGEFNEFVEVNQKPPVTPQQCTVSSSPSPPSPTPQKVVQEEYKPPTAEEKLAIRQHVEHLKNILMNKK